MNIFLYSELVIRAASNYNVAFIKTANVAELVDALDLGSSRLSCESSSLSIRTILFYNTGLHRPVIRAIKPSPAIR